MLRPGGLAERELAAALSREAGIQLQETRGIGVTLVPRLGFVVKGAALRPAGFTGVPPFRAERILVEADADSLWSGRLKLSRLRIENPTLHLRVDAAGRRNWDLTQRGDKRMQVRVASADGKAAITAIAAPQESRRERAAASLGTVAIQIAGGALTYDDEARGRHFALRNLDATMQSDAASRRVTLDGGFDTHGGRVAFNAASDLPSAETDTAPLRLKLRTSAGEATLDGVAALRGERGFRGRVKLALLSADALGAWIGEAGPIGGKLDGATAEGLLDVGESGAVLREGVLTAPDIAGAFALSADFTGKGQLELQDIALHGGRLNGSLSIDASQRAAVIGGKLDAADIETLPFLDGATGFDWLSGKGTAALAIAGGGESFDSVLSSLTGEGRLTIVDGAVEGLDIPKLAGRAMSGEFKRWRREQNQQTRFDSLAARFTIEKGTIFTRDLAMTGPGILVTGEGETHLPRKHLDYRLLAKVEAAAANEEAKGEARVVQVPLIVRGGWEKPDITPDLDRMAKDPNALLGTAKAFGKSVEKFTDGQIKSEDFGRALDSLFGGKKKRKDADPDNAGKTQ